MDVSAACRRQTAAPGASGVVSRRGVERHRRDTSPSIINKCMRTCTPNACHTTLNLALFWIPWTLFCISYTGHLILSEYPVRKCNCWIPLPPLVKLVTSFFRTWKKKVSATLPWMVSLDSLWNLDIILDLVHSLKWTFYQLWHADVHEGYSN